MMNTQKVLHLRPRTRGVVARRWAVALAGAMSLAACGGTSGPETLSIVSGGISGGGGLAKNAAGGMDAAPSADMRLAVWNVEYKVEGTLPDLGSSGQSWKMGKVSKDDALSVASKIAAELGVKGKFVAAPNDNSSYSMGYDPKTGTGMWLYIGSPRESSWSYYSGSNPVAVSPSCEKSSDGTERCTEPTPVNPPKDLPSKDEATARVREIIDVSGDNSADYRFVATKDEWGTNVQAIRQFDGLETYYNAWVSFGENGTIVSASGIIIDPVKGDEYPLISPTKAIERLTSSMFGMPMYGMAKGGAAVDTALAPGESTAGGGVSPVAPDSTDATKPGDSVPNDRTPVDSIPVPEPTVIPITDARLSLLPAYLADGRIVLLPAYTYSNKDGDVGSVFAVEDKYIVIEQPASQNGDEPKPIEPGIGSDSSGSKSSGSSGSASGKSGSGTGANSGVSGSGSGRVDVPAAAITERQANELIGLSEKEATKVAEGYGWTLRVAERDGESFMLTSDYRGDRVNLIIAKGIVTTVKIG